MFATLTGLVSEKSDRKVILDVHGIGFEIQITPSDAEKMCLQQEEKLHIHMAVSETGIALYGFLNAQTKEFFQLLLTVNGIGPKSALNILSNASLETLTTCIALQDAKTLAKQKGISTKIAEKIIAECKGKIADVSIPVPTPSADTNIQQAIDAVASTGFPRQACLEALRDIPDAASLDVEQLINTIFERIKI